jgi:hypothetical protein
MFGFMALVAEEAVEPERDRDEGVGETMTTPGERHTPDRGTGQRGIDRLLEDQDRTDASARSADGISA